ncbi:MAG: hypothetical protein J0L67_04125 [Cytophagales bacterium]|nr:hypothetical protein [Cytophagales bacterium]
MILTIIEKTKKKIWVQIFIIYTRFLLGGVFVFASIIKIKGLRFTSESGEGMPINSVLHFFETLYQSGLNWQFLGWSQLIAGFLLMTQRYAKLGTLVFFPIILNIFFITLSIDFHATLIVTTLMMLANVVLVGWHWNAYRILINQQFVAEEYHPLIQSKTWEITGLVLFIFTSTYRIIYNEYDGFLWFSVSVLIGLVGFLVGLKNHRSIGV